MRALYEGAAPTAATLGQAAGLTERGIANMAAREGWIAASRGSGTRDQLQALRTYVLDLAEEIRAGRTEALTSAEKARIDGISAAVRTVEKIDEITRSSGGAKDNQIGKDADMAGVLRRIDDRIIELAKGLAARLVQKKPGCR